MKADENMAVMKEMLLHSAFSNAPVQHALDEKGLKRLILKMSIFFNCVHVALGRHT